MGLGKRQRGVGIRLERGERHEMAVETDSRQVRVGL
jgi:hypothetical protein